MSEDIKAYPGDKLELVLFSITIICNTSNLVFNVSKVHEIRWLKVLRHLNISTNGWFSDLVWHLDLFYSPELVHRVETFSIAGTEAHNYTVQKLVKYDWYKA